MPCARPSWHASGVNAADGKTPFRVANWAGVCPARGREACPQASAECRQACFSEISFANLHQGAAPARTGRSTTSWPSVMPGLVPQRWPALRELSCPPGLPPGVETRHEDPLPQGKRHQPPENWKRARTRDSPSWKQTGPAAARSTSRQVGLLAPQRHDLPVQIMRGMDAAHRPAA